MRSMHAILVGSPAVLDRVEFRVGMGWLRLAAERGMCGGGVGSLWRIVLGCEVGHCEASQEVSCNIVGWVGPMTATVSSDSERLYSCLSSARCVVSRGWHRITVGLAQSVPVMLCSVRSCDSRPVAL